MAIAEAKKILGNAAIDYFSAANFHLGGLVDPDAVDSSEEARQAYGAAGRDFTRFGNTNLVVVMRAQSKAVLQDAQHTVLEVLEKAGFRAHRPRLAAFDVVLSTFPGDVAHHVRKYPVHALNVAHIAPLHEREAGAHWNDSEAFSGSVRVPPLTYAVSAPRPHSLVDCRFSCRLR
jgi:hypothetical protein